MCEVIITDFLNSAIKHYLNLTFNNNLSQNSKVSILFKVTFKVKEIQTSYTWSAVLIISFSKGKEKYLNL